MPYQDIRRAKAIEQANKNKFLKVNPELDDGSGIYILLRTDENGIVYFYVGQSVHILSRLAQHMVGFQHIDLSLKSRKLISEDNPHGWNVKFKHYPINELDEWEQRWILELTKRGYQCRYNKTSGSQGDGKEKINEYRPSKGYRDGLEQGRKNLAKELSHIIDKHLVVSLKPEKQNNKVSQKAYDKFNDLLKVDE